MTARFDTLNAQSPRQSSDGDRATAQSDIVLSGKDLRRSFGGIQAVAGMSFTLRRGSITGLIGPNGAGKSTLFHLISGVIRPHSGRVMLFGEEVTNRRPHERAQLGMVRSFQLSREFGALTVLENLMLAPQNQIGESLFPLFFQSGRVRAREKDIYVQAVDVLKTTGLTPLRDEYAGNLSGGQKKLLELARALMTGCSIILLDEPGAGVNQTLMHTLTDMIERLNVEHGKTFLIIEHDMDLIARLCDPVIVMTEGRHLVEGPFDEVRRDTRVIQAYLGGGGDDA